MVQGLGGMNGAGSRGEGSGFRVKGLVVKGLGRHSARVQDPRLR